MYYRQVDINQGGKIMSHSVYWCLSMPLSERLITLRKQRSLSQQAMADAIGIHANSWKKYETGQAQPSLDVLKKIATSLNVSTDFLLFDEHERVPVDELSLQFEAISQLPDDEQSIVREVLESLIIKYQSRRWDSARQAAKKKEE
nr:helix-turn-helix domain-containing protein [Photorhabdus bodei]